MAMPYVLDLIDDNVATAPNAPALITEDGRTYSYRILDEIADSVAKELASAIKCANVPGDETPLVAVMITRGVGMIAAILGTLKAGGAYVPVDPTFPPDRQTYIFAQAKCQVLVTDKECLEQAISLGVIIPPTLVINPAVMLPTGIAGSPILRSVNLPSFDQFDKAELVRAGRAKVAMREHGGLMYVLYTSGSTGKPKGVMVRHAGVVSQMEWFRDELQVNTHSRVLGLATVCFDISVLEMFLPLVSGGGLVLVNQSSQKDPFRLLEIIKTNKVSVVQATPTTYDMFFVTGWMGDKNIDFLVGGEAFRPSLVTLAQNSKSLRNIYGPTETTIWASSYLVPQDPKLLSYHNGAPVIPVGMPIKNMIFYIADPEDYTKQLPDGEEGELLIGGIGVSEGYLNAPDLTKDRFVKNPFGPGNVYRTGDLVKRQVEGSRQYIFMRRIDFQVKIDGFRIELSEIEYVFMSHPLVVQAVVLLKQGKLVLYIRHNGDNLVLSRKELMGIRDHAARSLMYYMMPKVFVQVKKFKETPSGKIDRNVLPDPSEVPAGCVFRPGDGDSDEAQGGDDEVKGRDGDGAPTCVSTAAAAAGAGAGADTGAAKAVTALANHICSIMERVRSGRRPQLNSSFASIGVDSLGAVMFLKYLSDSVGGVRIEPSKIYTSGVTVRSFSEDLYRRLVEEKPEALEKLGIDVCQTNVLSPRSVAIHSPDLEANSEYDYEGADDAQKLEASFEDMMTSNRALLEGIRGVFTFLVLYDHFHYMDYPISDVIQVDIYLFVLISGFTTALQLREVPRFQHDSYKGSVKLLPRPSFNLKKFMISRLVGLIPILWLALLLNAGPWYRNNSGTVTTRCICSGLYLIGMQSWWRPTCHEYGPNNILYASLLINIFLIYGVGRKYIIEPLQNMFINWVINEDISPVTLQATRTSSRGGASLAQKIGRLAVQLTYNRTSMSMVFPMVALWWMYGWFFFIIMQHFTFAKNALVFVPYFMAGVGAAAALESIHFAFWDYNRRLREADRRNQPFNSQTFVGFLNRVITYSESLTPQMAFPWIHESDFLGQFFPSGTLQGGPSLGGTAQQEANGAVYTAVPGGQNGQSGSVSPMEISDLHDDHQALIQTPLAPPPVFKFCCYVWRFGPDVISIIIGYLLSPDLDKYYWDWMWFVGVPTAFLALICVSMLQRGSARLNLSRFFLESKPFTTMGYASYAIYLFQRIVFTFWMPLFYFGPTRGYSMDIGNPGNWFENLPLFFKFLSFTGLTLVGWWVHKYFQDQFVSYLYVKFCSSAEN